MVSVPHQTIYCAHYVPQTHICMILLSPAATYHLVLSFLSHLSCLHLACSLCVHICPDHGAHVHLHFESRLLGAPGLEMMRSASCGVPGHLVSLHRRHIHCVHSPVLPSCPFTCLSFAHTCALDAPHWGACVCVSVCVQPWLHSELLRFQVLWTLHLARMLTLTSTHFLPILLHWRRCLLTTRWHDM